MWTLLTQSKGSIPHAGYYCTAYLTGESEKRIRPNSDVLVIGTVRKFKRAEIRRFGACD
jgi:hypothetical protein